MCLSFFSHLAQLLTEGGFRCNTNRRLQNPSKNIFKAKIVQTAAAGYKNAVQKIEALRAGADKDGLLTLPEIMRYVKRAGNRTPAELGRIDKQGEKSSGGFVFCQGGC